MWFWRFIQDNGEGKVQREMEKERKWFLILSLDHCDTWAAEMELIIVILITRNGVLP